MVGEWITPVSGPHWAMPWATAVCSAALVRQICLQRHHLAAGGGQFGQLGGAGGLFVDQQEGR
jgi:hypothetical protein